MQTKSHLLRTQGKTNHAHNSKMPFFVAAFTRREKKNETIKQFLQNIIGTGIAAPEPKTYEIKRTVRLQRKTPLTSLEGKTVSKRFSLAATASLAPAGAPQPVKS